MGDLSSQRPIQACRAPPHPSPANHDNHFGIFGQIDQCGNWCRGEQFTSDLIGTAVAGRLLGNLYRIGGDPFALLRLPLGNAGVAALPDHPDAHVGGVDAHRVVGLVADIEMGFVDRLDLRADAAVPQQIDGRTGWRGSAPAVSTPASSRRVGESERPAGGGEDRNGLGGAVPHSPPALMRAAS